MRNFGTDEQSSSSVGTRGYASSTADAGSRIHSEIGVFLGNGNRVAIGRAACGSGNKSTGGDDAVEGAAVDREILHNRECFGAPGLKINHIAIFEVAHVQLANRGALESAMSLAIDHETAHA